MNNCLKTPLLLAPLAVVLLHGCGAKTESTSNGTSSTGQSSGDATTPQVALAQPASGSGNVQGKVLWNDKPAANIEVTLSEKFSTIMGMSGKQLKARTDKNGDYVIKNVPPKEYEGLTARVFDTETVIFIKTGIMEAQKYNVEDGKTLFVDPTNLFKSDLKVLYPKAAGTVPTGQTTFKWAAYPSASYYKFNLYPDDYLKGVSAYDQRVDGTTFKVEKPLTKGGYRIEIAAYNGSDHKISQSGDGYKFRAGP